jgi:hypothetical protein
MTPKIRSVGRGPAGRRYLSSDRELRLGVYFWFRLFNVVPETTARFSYLDDRSRIQSPPCMGTPLITLIRLSILGGQRSVGRRLLRPRDYSPFQRPISLVARATSRSASLAMITLRLS